MTAPQPDLLPVLGSLILILLTFALVGGIETGGVLP